MPLGAGLYQGACNRRGAIWRQQHARRSCSPPP